MIVFLRLLLAHFVADFLLQPRSWVNDKNQYGIKSIRLFYHILIVTFLSTVFTIDYFTWKIPVFIFLLHYLTDLGKIYLKPKKVNHLLWFLTDQIVHLFIIGLITGLADENFWQYVEIMKDSFANERILIYLLSYFFVIWPSMVTINLATRYWQKQVNHTLEPNLKNAGKWIGVLERILVLTFVLSAQFQAIGFLIAAKSILRISVKNEATARIMSEYVLIGTLISFTIAILTGMLANSVL